MISSREHQRTLWDRHHEEHRHLLGEVERERLHIADEMEKLNNLRQAVLTDRGLLSTKEETAGVRSAFEALVDAVEARLEARVELYAAAVDEVKKEQVAQRARTAAYTGALGIGLTALTVVLRFA